MSHDYSETYVRMAEDVLRGYRQILGEMKPPKAGTSDALLTAIACALIAIAKRMPEGTTR